MEEAIECWLSVLDNLGRVKEVAIKPKITRMTTSISSQALQCKVKTTKQMKRNMVQKTGGQRILKKSDVFI